MKSESSNLRYGTGTHHSGHDRRSDGHDERAIAKAHRQQERTTAIHEAGHAVIARILGLVCGKVTIKASGTSGYGIIAAPEFVCDCWEQRGKNRPIQAAFRGRILAYMAGREAEVELLGQCQGGDNDDQSRIGLMLEDLYPGEWDQQDKFERRLRRFARNLVRRHRPKIEVLSRALIEQRTMSDKRVRLAAGVATTLAPPLTEGGLPSLVPSSWGACLIRQRRQLANSRFLRPAAADLTGQDTTRRAPARRSQTRRPELARVVGT